MSRRRPSVKRAYHHGNLREDLIGAALQIIQKKGGADLTLADVAARLGVSTTAPYRHFRSKKALLAAVAADGFVALVDEVEKAVAAAGADVVARFQAVGHAYVRFALARPAHFEVMYGPRPEEFSRGPVSEAGRRAFVVTVDAIIACQRAGRAAAGDPTVIAVEAWSMAHGLVVLYRHGLLPRSLTEAQLVAMAGDIALFLRGRGDRAD